MKPPGQLAKRNIPVKLYEMKPKKHTPAHSYSGFAELVCSNSLRSDRIENAVGLLKEELRLLDSLIMEAADSWQSSRRRRSCGKQKGFFRLYNKKDNRKPQYNRYMRGGALYF